MTKIAFITCEPKPLLTSDDDELAQVLRRSGSSVTVTPWSREANWGEFDLILIRSAWDYHLRVDEFTQWIRSLQLTNTLVLNSPELLLWNIHKGYLLDLRGKGIQIPPTTLVTKGSKQSLKEILSSNGWTKAVVKPAISATAYQTWTTIDATAINDQEKFAHQLETADVLVQKFLPEISTSGELSLIYFNGEFSHAILKRAKKDDFRVQGDFGGTSEKIDVPERLIVAGDKIISSAPGKPLYARVDGVLVNDEFVLMELELIEPYLFFKEAHGSAQQLARQIESLLTNAHPVKKS